MSEKELLFNRNGVELWAIHLRHDSGIVATAYIVKAPKRTPEDWRFGDRQTAEAKVQELLSTSG